MRRLLPLSSLSSESPKATNGFCHPPAGLGYVPGDVGLVSERGVILVSCPI
jgi:hypothetical protein